MHGLYNISSFSTTDPAGMGNIRVMFAQTGKVLQDQSYYPFGMTMGSSLTFQVEDQLPDNKYKYNGNPDGDRGQDDFGLNWYDYRARMYDPAIGRWNGIDAHAENYFSLSSYNYGLNNPIRMIDPDGMDARLYDIDEWNAFSMDEYGNITLYGSSSGQGNDKTKGKTSKKGNDKKDDNSENNPNQGDPIKDHLLDVAAGNAPGNTFGSQVIGGSYSKSSVSSRGESATNSGGFLRSLGDGMSYFSGIIGITQIGMLEYRMSLPIMSKVGTFSNFVFKYGALGKFGGGLSYVGAGVSLISNISEVRSGGIGLTRFSYRTGSIVTSLLTGFMIGGPKGAIAGTAVGLLSAGFEYIYDDIAVPLWNETNRQIFNVENAIKHGWNPNK